MTREPYAFLGDLGAVTVQAGLSRFVAGPNRDPDYAIFGPFRSSIIPSTTTTGKTIYSEKPAPDELAKRVAIAQTAFREGIDQAIERLGDRFRSLLLLDLHSFGRSSNPRRAQQVLGRYGPAVTGAVQLMLPAAGLPIRRRPGR